MKKEDLSTLKKEDLLAAANTLFDELEAAKNSVEEKLAEQAAEFQKQADEFKAAAAANEEELNKVINDLRSSLTETKKEVSSQKKTVMHAGIEYEVKLPVFRHKGKTFKADDLKTKTELVKELVEMGAGVLVEVKK